MPKAMDAPAVTAAHWALFFSKSSPVSLITAWADCVSKAASKRTIYPFIQIPCLLSIVTVRYFSKWMLTFCMYSHPIHVFHCSIVHFSSQVNVCSVQSADDHSSPGLKSHGIFGHGNKTCCIHMQSQILKDSWFYDLCGSFTGHTNHSCLFFFSAGLKK